MDAHSPNGGGEPSLAAKVRFLSQPGAYAPSPALVVCRETHMSWVFLTADRAYKLKKPVRFPYLDFSTIDRRERECRWELRLNRRLAPDVYLDVQPLTVSGGGLAIGGPGPIVDWLVVMRRLDEALMLDRLIVNERVSEDDVDRLGRILARFYRGARRTTVPPGAYPEKWRRSLAFNRRILLDRRFKLPMGTIRRIDRAQRRFLAVCGSLLVDRVRAAMIVDGHGDLRPEHIWIGESIRIIDCLEFNAELRAVDPLDEIAYLSLECDRLGAAWIGARIERPILRALHDGVAHDLFVFYRCHRATLRARLAIAHLLEPNPRTPEKWPRLAREYLALATADAVRLERIVRRRAGR